MFPNGSISESAIDRTLSRRSLLKVGGLGLAGLTQADLLRAESSYPLRKATAKSVILLFQFGGPSHLDTFDPKPDAPAEIRGEFASIETSNPALRVTEHLPELAKIADKFALVRSVHHKSSSHNPGAYYSLSGREPLINIVTLNASATDFPHPGSVVDHLDTRPSEVPRFVSLPTMIADGPFRTPGEFAGFLGKKHDPLWVLKDPNSSSFNVDELTLPTEIDIHRLDDRRTALEQLNTLSELADKTAAVKGMSDYQARAMALLTSAKTRKAFQIQEETDAMRDRYGRHTYGQSVLLARRLVEAGVRFVTVYFSRGIRGWDTHEDNFASMKRDHCPKTDQTLSALLLDLEQRGLLSDTLVYWTGDFGRTPKINDKAGRDHWPPCQTVLFAGGGVQGGRLYGSSDKTGAYPHDNPCRPDDITATVFRALGFDPATHITDQLARSLPISAGRSIEALFV